MVEPSSKKCTEMQPSGCAVLAADVLLRQDSPWTCSSGSSGCIAVARGWRTCMEVGNLPRLPLKAAELIAKGLAKALHQRPIKRLAVAQRGVAPPRQQQLQILGLQANSQA